MIPSPTEIQYFLELYHVKHVSKAAMRLGVTQPTLTQSLQRLELKLGASLFFRTKQGVIPNKNAVQFYSKAKVLKDCWDEIHTGVTVAHTQLEGSFLVGCHQSVGAYTIPTLTKRINEEAPRIGINLVHDFSRKITSGVVAYEIDLGFVVNPPKHPDLVMKKLGDDKVTFWKQRGAKNLPKNIFADATRIQVEELLGKTFKKHFEGWNIIQSSSLELVRTLTKQGLGIGVLPERVAKVDDAALTLFREDFPSRPDEIYLIYRKEVLSSRAGKELVRLATFPL